MTAIFALLAVTLINSRVAVATHAPASGTYVLGPTYQVDPVLKDVDTHVPKGKLYDFAIKEELESRRQDLKPNAYVRSGSIYAMSRRYVMNEKRYFSGKSLAYILPLERTINIDDKNDLIIAKYKLKN